MDLRDWLVLASLRILLITFSRQMNEVRLASIFVSTEKSSAKMYPNNRMPHIIHIIVAIRSTELLGVISPYLMVQHCVNYML